MYILQTIRFVFAIVSGALLSSGPVATAAEHKVVMESLLRGSSGDSICCYLSDGREEFTVKFSDLSGKLTVVVAMKDDKGVEVVKRFDGDQGALPLINGLITSIRVDFRGDATCKVLLHRRKE